jgi:DNA mismatch repair protein MutH
LNEVCGVQEQTAQVPKQGLNLHRESAFCVAPVAQVSALKWNLRHLAFSLAPQPMYVHW